MSTVENHELVGSCHCGKVSVRLPESSVGVVACHCADCQVLHGNFFALLATDRDAVRWQGEEHVAWYRSSAANERGFCTTCGSRIAKRPVEGAKIMLSAGLFGRALPKTLMKNLWLESKPDWYETPRTGPFSSAT